MREKIWLNTEECTSSFEEFEFIKKEFPLDPEEKIQLDIFCSVLIDINNKRPVMIELGSSGTENSFYSLLFEKYFNYNCINICTEVDYNCIINISDFFHEKNHLKKCKLYHGYSGEWKSWQAPGNIISNDVGRVLMDKIWNENFLDKVDILHCDIQGSEISLCEELVEYNLLNRIRFFFISIHEGQNNECYFTKDMTFRKIIDILSNNTNINILFADPYKGGCGDGLIICENLNFNNV